MARSDQMLVKLGYVPQTLEPLFGIAAGLFAIAESISELAQTQKPQDSGVHTP